MAVVTMRQMLESGVHFGHQTRRWNPKMKRYIFTERNGIYIIDLTQSLTFVDRAYSFIKDTVARGGTVMFVGTKKQAQEAVAEQATRVGMPYVNERWLGGMLTNFQTVHKRLQRLKELEQIDFDDVAGSGMTKKELLVLRREKEKLERTLGGIRDMSRVPSAIWVVDTNKEQIAVGEARKLGIPVIAILDSNCDPDVVDFPIPGNDDAIRAVGLLTRVIADAVADGLVARASGAAAGVTAEPLAEWEAELLAAHEAEQAAALEAEQLTAVAAEEAAAQEAARAAAVAAEEAAAQEAARAAAPKAEPAVAQTPEEAPAPAPAAAVAKPEQPKVAITAADVKKLRDLTSAGMMECKKALTEANGDLDAAVELLRISGAAKAAKRAERTARNGLVASSGGSLVELLCETDFVAKNSDFQDLGQRIVAVADSEAIADRAALAAAELPAGKTVAEEIASMAGVIGEKLELGRVARLDGTIATYMHKRSADLPAQVGVLVAYEGSEDTARQIGMQIAAMRPDYLTREDVPAEVVANERRIAEATAREEGKPEAALPKIVEGRVNGFFKDRVLMEQPSVQDNKKTVKAYASANGAVVTGFARIEVGN
ncbi:MAG: 30S ribosomal protein S2 [Candidatus Nanopelagicales bacterium]